MRSKTTWRIIAVLTLIASVLSSIEAVLSEGYIRVIFALCSVCFLISCAVMVMTRRKYLEAFDRNSTVNCLKLKRPGVDRKDTEEIIPKGKMPGS
ncbi:MAG: hypothetical protein KRP56_00165 [Candidatus Methanogranum gryphiswaldense]|nr:MAG: hypothetical protein KRP56_00165 [Candidatus Methanogranum sp. U3.2.1]